MQRFENNTKHIKSEQDTMSNFINKYKQQTINRLNMYK